tara:strand:- start:4922 stop:5077 length:156 start_codon:yes stop_codon:yes gene_type:complete
MKYIFKNKNQKKSYLSVIRAISRLNKYEEQQSNQAVVWNRKSIIKDFLINS